MPQPMLPLMPMYAASMMGVYAMQTATGMFWFAWSPGAITNPKEEA